MWEWKYSFLAFIFILTACSPKPNVVKYERLFKNDGVNIVSHGWYTGIVLPASSIQNDLPEIAKRFDDAGYIELGWGDKGFYQAQKITSGLILRAIFWPTKSVMHAVAISAETEVKAYFKDSEIEP